MTYPLPPSLARRHKEVLEAFATAEAAFHENGEEVPAEEISRQALDFLLLCVEYFGQHPSSDENRDWESFLVDFVHTFTYGDEDSGVRNALAALDLDDVVLECCALDEDDERTSVQRLAALRDELLEIRGRLDDLSFI